MPYERVAIKMKPGSTKEDENRLIEDFITGLPNYLGYRINLFSKFMGNIE
jgi:hypothetical protein